MPGSESFDFPNLAMAASRPVSENGISRPGKGKAPRVSPRRFHAGCKTARYFQPARSMMRSASALLLP